MRKWSSTASWRMWSALILTSWICVLLASANVVLAVPPQQAEGCGQVAQANPGNSHNRKSQPCDASNDVARLKNVQPFVAQPKTDQDKRDSIAESEKTIATFTIVLAFVAAVQACIAWKYTRYAGKQWQALVHAQSANLFPRSCEVIDDLSKRLVDLKLRNYGPSPALLISDCFEAHVGERLRKRPVYRKPHISSYPAGWVISPHNIQEHRQGVIGLLNLTDDQITQIEAEGKVQLWVYGFIRYQDTFRRKHEMRFVFRRAPELFNKFAWVPDAPPRYTKSY